MKKLAAIAATALVTAGCGGRSTVTVTVTTPAPPPTTTTPPQAPMSLTVFEVRGGVLHPVVVHVPRTRAIAAAAVATLGRAAPVTIHAGTAIVGIAKATDAQVAEIVYTLTQFPTIRRVDVAGRSGLTRDDFASYVPPILVETPAPGATVPQTFHVSGTASVFEATLVVQAIRAGAVVERQSVMTSEGAPGRGPFDATLHATPGSLTIQAFAPSAADGTPQHEVDVDVVVRP